MPFIQAQDAVLISFKIEDQFERVYTEKEYLESIVVIIGSDKDGSQYNGIWGNAIGDSLKNEKNYPQIKFLRIADLRGVPFFVKGFVKGKFPKDKTRWVLLDWKGRFAKTYDFAPASSNIVIVNRQGAVVYKAFGKEPEQQKLAAICSELRKLMKE